MQWSAPGRELSSVSAVQKHSLSIALNSKRRQFTCHLPKNTEWIIYFLIHLQVGYKESVRV